MFKIQSSTFQGIRPYDSSSCNFVMITFFNGMGPYYSTSCSFAMITFNANLKRIKYIITNVQCKNLTIKITQQAQDYKNDTIIEESMKTQDDKKDTLIEESMKNMGKVRSCHNGGSFLEVKKYDVYLKEGDEEASVFIGSIF